MKSHRTISILILLGLLLASIRPAQAADEPPWHAVDRPGPCTGGSINIPPDIVENKGVVFFIAQDGHDSSASHGAEIWRSDSSENGTWQVTNLTPDDSPIAVDLKIVFDNHLYFTQSRPEGDWLWMTDGAPAEEGEIGAENFVAFWPPATGGFTLDAFTILGENLYFVVNAKAASVSRSELWVTDGTTAGTHLVKALTAPARIKKIVAFHGALYFNAVSSNAVNLWRSDGTASGTVEFTNFSNGSTLWSGEIAAVGGQLYFVGAVNNQQVLFRTDGTSSPVEVFQIPFGGSLRNMVGVGERVYFGLGQAGFGELWRTDGSAETTQLVRQFGENSNFNSPDEPTAVGNTLYFLASEDNQPHEVWKTDGTEAGTIKVTGFASPNQDSIYPGQLTAFGNRLYFFAQRRSIRGNQFWVTDGTQGKTQMLFDTTITGEGGFDFSDVALSGDRLFLTGTHPCMGAELLVIDTPGGSTRFVKDINKDLMPLIVRRDLVEHKSKTYFFANDYIHGNELWQSDGTMDGTKILMDLNPTGSAVGLQDANMDLFPAGEFLYFTVNSPGADERRLWRTNATPAGTQPVQSVSGPVGGTIFHPVAFQNNLFFFIDGNSEYHELWRTDGTTNGTKRLKMMPVAVDGVEFNQKLYFLFQSPYNSSLELWETNGTEEGTQRVTWIYGSSNAPSNRPYRLVPFKGKLYFCAPGYSSQWALWYTDGTPAGTDELVEVGDLEDCAVQAGPSNLFVISEGGNSYQISKLNDAGNGVTVLHEASRSLSTYAIAGDRLYFRDSPLGSSNQALWTSDGTRDGTVELLSDSGPVHLFWGDIVAGGQYFFTAEEAGSGLELWTTDGTKAGTRLAADFWPGSSSSNASIIGADSRRLWIEANSGQAADGSNSYSLFVYDIPWVPGEEPKLIFLPFVSR